MFFDGASRTGPKSNIITGVGVVLISPNDLVIHRAYSLMEPCSNNVAEYNTLIVGLQLAKQLEVDFLEAYGDSNLIVSLVHSEYEVRHEDLFPYHQVAAYIIFNFTGFFIEHVTRL